MTNKKKRIGGLAIRLTAKLLAGAAAGSITLAMPTAVLAQEVAQDAPRSYDIPAASLTDALNVFAQQSGVQLNYEADLTTGLAAKALRGRFTRREALSRLLAVTGLVARDTGSGSVTIARATSGSMTLDELQVRSATTAADSQTQVETERHRRRTNEADTIIVTGQREIGNVVSRNSSLGFLGDRDVYDTPFNVTSYTQDTIDRFQARTVGDVLANDPSVRKVTSGGAEQDQYTFRGFQTYNTDVAFNGLYGLVPQSLIDANAIARLDVFKGPSALINGISPSGSIGGAINIVPKRAQDTPTADLTLRYVSDAQFGIQADVGRRFGGDHAFGIRANIAYRDGDLALDHAKQRIVDAQIALDYDRDGTRFSLDAAVQQDMTHGNGGSLRVLGPFPIPKAPRAETNFFQPWKYDETHNRFVALRVEHDFGDMVTVYAAYGTAHSDERLMGGVVLYLNDALGNAIDTPGSNSANYVGVQTGEIGLHAAFKTGPVHHRLSMAASIYHDEGGSTADDTDISNQSIITNIYRPVIVPKPMIARIDLSTIPLNGYDTFKGGAIADTLSVFDERALLTVGIRRQNVVSGGYDASGHTVQSYDASAWTPLVGLVVKPLPHLSLYANYIEGLQQGEIVATPYLNAGRVLPPFKSIQYEVGAKYDFGTFGTSISLFQIKQPNEVATPAFAQQTAQTLTTNGEQRNRGMELNVFGSVTPDLKLLGGVLLLDAVYQRTQDGLYDGNRAFGSPKISVNLGADWNVAFLPGVSVTTRGIYTSSQVLDQSNVQSIPGWFRLDLGGALRTTIGGRKLVFRANVENVADNGYWASTGRTNISRGGPRTFLLSLTAGF